MRILECDCGNTARLPESSIVFTCLCGRRYDPRTFDQVPPSIWQRGMNYLTAWLRWKREGRPLRDDATVQELRSICSQCELFDGTICTHAECGCEVGGPTIFGDKLRWATEHCPVGKW